MNRNKRAWPSEPALLFIGTLCADQEVSNHAQKILQGNFGALLSESPSLPWDYSPYYKDELGWPISRQFLFFENLIDPGLLVGIKQKTNEIEEELSLNGKRRINLDPGYLTLSKIVLASTKNYAHRVYLGKGIYAEVTMIFRDDTFRPHLFTYRDYQDTACIEIFMNARGMLKKMITKDGNQF
jgi:hypothetical protein